MKLMKYVAVVGQVCIHSKIQNTGLNISQLRKTSVMYAQLWKAEAAGISDLNGQFRPSFLGV